MTEKKDIIRKDLKMADVILDNHFLVLVLERFGIELGLHDKAVETVCNENNISLEVFLTVLNLHADIEYDLSKTFKCEDVIAIIQYLKNSHQYYIKEIYPEIINNIRLMYKLNKNTEMFMVDKFFKEYKAEVDEHFSYENDIVFPYILDLFKMLNSQKPYYKESDFLVAEYKQHHEDIKEKLEDLQKLLIQYLPPKDDRIIRRKILFDLFNLEQDLSIHAKIENEILIPLVEKMEIQLKNI